MKKDLPRILIRNIIVLCIFITSNSIKAQVTIGSAEPPHEDALLDLKQDMMGMSTKGALLPRVFLESTISPSPLTMHEEGMVVYNRTNYGDLTPGYYYSTGSEWVRLVSEKKSYMPQFFYMPPIVLATDVMDPTYDPILEQFNVNIHSLYYSQFAIEDLTTSTQSPSATGLPIIYEPSALEYYVTYFDKDVFDGAVISDEGILTYQLKSTITISDKTFMNIILKVK